MRPTIHLIYRISIEIPWRGRALAEATTGKLCGGDGGGNWGWENEKETYD